MYMYMHIYVFERERECIISTSISMSILVLVSVCVLQLSVCSFQLGVFIVCRCVRVWRRHGRNTCPNLTLGCEEASCTSFENAWQCRRERAGGGGGEEGKSASEWAGD